MSKRTATPWTMEKLHTRRVVRGPKGELVMVIERGCSDEDAEAMLSALNAHESNQEKIKALVKAAKGAFDRMRARGESQHDWYERCGTLFYQETGKLAPGKDCPGAAPEARGTNEEWEAWWDANYNALRAAIEKAGK